MWVCAWSGGVDVRVGVLLRLWYEDVRVGAWVKSWVGMGMLVCLCVCVCVCVCVFVCVRVGICV